MTSHSESFPAMGSAALPVSAAASGGAAVTPEAILPQITSPAQIRDLNEDQLVQLAREVRDRIIQVVSGTGGHFGAPLGAVDITVALMATCEFPGDRVVWDTGHQAYAWKLLTGRNDQFDTLRLYKGLSGFLKRTESEYDAFGAGHASTSIAAAVGMAFARDQQGKDNRVIAVIGDGAMTGGLAYEALNNAGLRKTDVTVILNDNEMSISDNVWVLHKVLNKFITDPAYNRVRSEIAGILSKKPFGDAFTSVAHRVEESIKGLVVPGLFFEQLGFRYIGPIDGHNIHEMTSILKKSRDLKGPILLHMITRKGKGYSFAEADPIKYHAAANMKIETGEMTKTAAPPAYTKVFGDTLAELGHEYPTIVAMTAAMPQGTGTDIFAKAHPERFYDIGIAEASGVTIAAGMACDGLKPFVAIYSTFIQRAYDQIVHDVALQHLPVRFVLDRAGLVGADGPTHHGVLDMSFLRVIPDMVICAPKDEQELRQMTRTMAEYEKGPIAMRYPRGNATGKHDLSLPYPALPIGKAEVITKGSRIALLGIGLMVSHFAEAAAILEQKLGHPVTLVNARWVKPLDADMLKEVAESHDFLFTAEDHTVVGGFGSAVNEELQALGIAKRATVFGIPDRWVDHGTPKELYLEIGMTGAQLADRVLEVVNAAKA